MRMTHFAPSDVLWPLYLIGFTMLLQRFRAPLQVRSQGPHTRDGDPSAPIRLLTIPRSFGKFKRKSVLCPKRVLQAARQRISCKIRRITSRKVTHISAGTHKQQKIRPLQTVDNSDVRLSPPFEAPIGAFRSLRVPSWP